MQLSHQTYKRGQVEHAVWMHFASNRPRSGRLPQAFRTRVKRLFEIDRQMETEAPDFAFFDHAPEGRGFEVSFSAFNCFSLAIGLDLLDAGYKQKEVVVLLKHIRPNLEKYYRAIEACPPAPAERIAANDRAQCPSYVMGRQRFADCRVFLVLEKVELTETHLRVSSRAKRQAVQFEPVFCKGIEALMETLQLMGESFRKALVLELGEMAAVLWACLENAPVPKRGWR